MANTNEAKPEQELTEAELEQVKGGIGLLLPAVQKVRETSTTSSGGGGGQWIGDISVSNTR